jgi:hypothetical protein
MDSFSSERSQNKSSNSYYSCLESQINEFQREEEKFMNDLSEDMIILMKELDQLKVEYKKESLALMHIT